MTADSRFTQAAASLGYSFGGEIKVGGNYVSVARDGNVMYVSGQVPRVGSEVVVTGRVGEQVTLAQAQVAAKVCAMRALVLLQRELGTLENVRQVLRVTVYTQSAADFTQQSEVADGASELLHFVPAKPASTRARRWASISCPRTPASSSISWPPSRAKA